MLRRVKVPYFRCFLFCSLLVFILLSGYACALNESEFAPVHLVAVPKTVHEQYSEETIHIDSKEYTIPPLWRGKRVHPVAGTQSLLKQVPSRFVKNGGELFLRSDACEAFIAMAEKAEGESVSLRIDSGYRSVWYQKKIYRHKMEKGKTFEEIAHSVAPPGYSQHALGCAVDFSPSNWRFARTEMYKWLQENGEKFGFTETYPENNPNGQPWEASHWCFHPEGERPYSK